MKSVFTLQSLLPIGLLLLQTVFFFLVSIYLLYRFKIIKRPLAGLEYSNVIVASAILFGMFYTTTADIQGVLQAFKTYQNSGQPLPLATFTKFSQFFLVVLSLVILYGGLVFLVVRLLLGFKSSIQEIQDGNIPGSILMAVIIISLGILFQRVGEEMMTYLTPQYVNLR